MVRRLLLVSILMTATSVGRAEAGLWFERLSAHWGEIDDSFVDFLAETRPQVAQVGFFGPEYYSALPYMQREGKDIWYGIGGGPKDIRWYRGMIERAHGLGVKVIGHFSVSLIYGDEAINAGWFGFYNDLWDTSLLGEKPRASASDLLQRRSDGSLYSNKSGYVEGSREYLGCPNNPYWREALKRMVKAGIDLGLDGFTVVFSAPADCTCEWCQKAFKEYLRERYSGKELKQVFGIENLETHHFDSINGFFEPKEFTPYKLECLRFSELSVKKMIDEVFIEYGRSLKPDLIVGVWDHIYRSSFGPEQVPGTFAQLDADERCVLPSELWGRGEDFICYSIGNWQFGGMYYRPAEGLYAGFLLEAKYLWEAAGGQKPVMIKKDDGVRIRTYIAEAVANGGAGYARGPNWRDPEARRIIAQYFRFLARHEEYYHPVESYAEVALIWPRRSVHRGDLSAIPAFKSLGEVLTKQRILYDVLLDENVCAERLAKYRLVIDPGSRLEEGQREAVEDFIRGGGALIGPKGEEPPAADRLLSYLHQAKPPFSTLDAPDNVLLTAFRQPGRIIVHLVNYKRDEEGAEGKSGAEGEMPLPEENVKVLLNLPEGKQALSVTLFAPEPEEETELDFQQQGDKLIFTVPRILVYAVAVIAFR